MSDDDPEMRRIEELLVRVEAGEASDAEVTELELHAERHPAVLLRLERGSRDARVSEGWLARLEADRRVAEIERSAITRVEQATGLVLLLGGVALSFFAPAAGAGSMTAGLVTLTYSFLRVRIRTARHDPYKDVER